MRSPTDVTSCSSSCCLRRLVTNSREEERGDWLECQNRALMAGDAGKCWVQREKRM